MKNELMVVGRELMVIDDGILDFVSTTLEHKAMALNEEVIKTFDRLNTDNVAIGKVLHTFSFEFPDISDQLRVLLNELARLNNKPQVPKDTDPLSGRKVDGEYDEMIAKALKSKADADNRFEQEVRQSQDGKLLERECKKLWRKLSSATHPDRVKDKSLHPIFDAAKKAFNDLNLQMLQGLWHDVSNYVKLRANNKDFQAYVKKQIAMKERDLAIAKSKLKELHSTLAYRALKASKSPAKDVRRTAYNAYIQKECMEVRKLIQKAINRNGDPYGFSAAFGDFFKPKKT